MSDLADVFELVHGGADSFRTVRATIRVWHDLEKEQIAFEREIEEEQAEGEGSGAIMMFAIGDPGGEPPPTEREETVRLWLERPGKRREEADGPEQRVSVTDGVKSWIYMPEFGALEQDVDPDTEEGEIDALFHPEWLLPAVELEIVGRASVASRDGVRLRATRRRPPPRDFDLDALWPGADEYDLVLDRERGILLRVEAMIEGAPFARSEVLEVAFDESFGPEVFRFQPPEGEEIRSPEEVWGQHEHVTTVEEAAAHAAFPVWLPSRLPAIGDRRTLGPGWGIHVLYQRAAERPRIPESLFVHYSHESGPSFALQQQAADAALEAHDPWELVESMGERYLVWEPERRKLPVPIQIRTVREGTEVQLSSQELSREELLEIARSLTPAATEPPSLTR